MLLAHKIALDPNVAQHRYFARAAGTARFAWNWALRRWKQEYALKREYCCGPSPSEVSLRRDLNAVKRDQFPWMFDVTKCAAQEAIIDLGSAFRAFFEGRAKYPVRKRKEDKPSFCAANEAGTFRADGKRIKLPVIGWVRMREAVRFNGQLKRATISCEAGRWFVSVMVETGDVKPVMPPMPFVGIDVGSKTLATLSTLIAEEEIEGPKAHKAALKRLRRANKALARKRRASANFRKAKARLAKLHRRIGAIRRDVTHKLTTRITKTFAVIGIEDLNVRGMLRNHRGARGIADASFFEFRRQIEYKARWYGARVVIADRWYPSSKTCSCCGVVNSTLGRAEVFRCNDCGFEAGRDINAARNLAAMAASSAAQPVERNRSGPVRKNRVKRAFVKQEPKPDLSLAA